MLQVEEQDRIYCCLPLYHSTGTIITLIAWHVGATLIVRRHFSARVRQRERDIER